MDLPRPMVAGLNRMDSADRIDPLGILVRSGITKGLTAFFLSYIKAFYQFDK
jgi:hypothetical protein